MSVTFALLCILLLFLLLLFLRPSFSTPHLVPPPPPPPRSPQSRQVSFTVVGPDVPYSLPAPSSPPFPTQPRWPSSLQKRKPSTPDSPRPPQPSCAQKPHAASVDQFGRILPLSPVSDMHAPTKSSRRLSTPLRLSFTSRRRSSSASYASTLIHLDQVDARPTSPLSSVSASQSPPQRTRFTNPFSNHTRSRTLSPPSTSKYPDHMPSNQTSLSSPSSPARPRTLISRVKSIFKSKPVPPEPPPITHPKPILTTISSRLRQRPVARTQPYGPPWNAPMPVPEWSISQHSLQKPSRTSPSPNTGRKSSEHQGSRLEATSMSPLQLSPRTFTNELDEKLFLLQEQRIQDSIPSPRG